MNAKKFNAIVITGTMICLILFALSVIMIDPYFHYHAPIEGHSYRIGNERYQNNGIVRHFEYDAIITGTSMTENFKTSEMDALFGTNSIKVPYAGGSYKEINDNLLVALKNNPDIKIIVLGIDTNSSLTRDKDEPFHGIADGGYQYPWYMIDDNLWNDVSYILNKSVLEQVVQIGLSSGESNSFDTAFFWGNSFQVGKDAVLASYERLEERIDVSQELTEVEKDMIRGNVRQNVVETAEAYPDVTFYLFIPPYSICWWDDAEQQGKVDYYINALRLETEELLQCENIRLFAFWNNYEMVCNLDNYKDWAHYSPQINSDILRWMADLDERYLLTKDNYLEYWNEVREFYFNYDYDNIFE
ncbi:MAG: hypothetical protein K2G70_04090 [Turicibacter sp.]|nr:hypothetical protein [Turicibacter sp.]